MEYKIRKDEDGFVVLNLQGDSTRNSQAESFSKIWLCNVVRVTFPLKITSAQHQRWFWRAKKMNHSFDWSGDFVVLSL